MRYTIQSDILNAWDLGTVKMQEMRYINNCKQITNFKDNVDYSHWFYHETWIIYNQEMINLILNDTHYYPYFKKAFVSDENYPGYLLSLYDKLNLCKNILTTHVNWHIKQTGVRNHPELYDKVNKDFCNMLQTQRDLLFARKFTKTSNVSEYFKS